MSLPTVNQNSLNGVLYANLLKQVSTDNKEFPKRLYFNTKTKEYKLFDSKKDDKNVEKGFKPLSLRKLTLIASSFKKEILSSSETAQEVAMSLEQMAKNKEQKSKNFITKFAEKLINLLSFKGFNTDAQLALKLSQKFKKAVAPSNKSKTTEIKEKPPEEQLKRTEEEEAKKQAEAKAQAEQKHKETEEAAKAAEDKKQAEAKAQAEQKRKETEEAAKAAEDKKQVEAKAQAEQKRKETEEAAKAAEDKKQAEAKAQAEQKRKETEEAAAKEKEREEARSPQKNNEGLKPPAGATGKSPSPKKLYGAALIKQKEADEKARVEEEKKSQLTHEEQEKYCTYYKGKLAELVRTKEEIVSDKNIERWVVDARIQFNAAKSKENTGEVSKETQKYGISEDTVRTKALKAFEELQIANPFTDSASTGSAGTIALKLEDKTSDIVEKAAYLVQTARFMLIDMSSGISKGENKEKIKEQMNKIKIIPSLYSIIFEKLEKISKDVDNLDTTTATNPKEIEQRKKEISSTRATAYVQYIHALIIVDVASEEFNKLNSKS